MCGIYGYAGNVKNPELLMRSLGVMNQSRGLDSTGIAVIGEKHRTICKRVVTADKFYRNKRVKELLNQQNSVVLGHNRATTVGAINKTNAHPFRIGKTIAVHNGTVNNLYDVRKHCKAKYATDSQYLIHMLEHYGNFGPAKGGMNLAAVQEKASWDLMLTRFNRSLWYADVKAGGVVFSSEKKHLLNAIQISDNQEEFFDIIQPGTANYFYLDVKGHLCDWQLNEEIETGYTADEAVKSDSLGFTWDSEDTAGYSGSSNDSYLTDKYYDDMYDEALEAFDTKINDWTDEDWDAFERIRLNETNNSKRRDA